MLKIKIEKSENVFIRLKDIADSNTDKTLIIVDASEHSIDNIDVELLHSLIANGVTLITL